MDVPPSHPQLVNLRWLAVHLVAHLAREEPPEQFPQVPELQVLPRVEQELLVPV